MEDTGRAFLCAGRRARPPFYRTRPLEHYRSNSILRNREDIAGVADANYKRDSKRTSAER
jgi:hypothetical protein